MLHSRPMPKKPRRRSSAVTLVMFHRLNADVANLRVELDDLRRESRIHLRRCAEIQAELDAVKKAGG